MTVYECSECPNRHCVSENTQNDHPTNCVFGMSYCNWHKAEANKKPSQLPKLTEEELKRRGIKWPEWAKFAYSLDTCFALFCENDPRSCIEDWSLHPPEDIPGQWEPGGFIERPKLPDWCKVRV